MKKLSLILFFLPVICFGQTVAYCGPYTYVTPLTLTSANNGQTISGDSIGNGSTQGIYINGANNIHITKCKIVNITNFAIHILNSTNITIDSCDIRNVGFGVYVEGSSSATIKVNNNYFKDINGINASYLGHAVQFNSIAASGGNQINYNRIENVKNITDTSSHPHDQISLFHCSGIVGDSIQVKGNWIRGGQLTPWPSSGYTGCGIGMGDEIGSYQVCRNNVLVSPGYAGIQTVQNGGTVNGISIDHNQIYNNTVSTVAAQGVTITGTVSNVKFNNNRIWWKNKNGNAVALTDGETSYYLGNPNGTLPGVTITGNTFLDTSLSPTIMLPTSMLFATCSLPTGTITLKGRKIHVN